MYITVYLLLLAPAALAVVGPSVSRCLAPAAAVRVLLAVAALAAAATVWGLTALAVGGLARGPQVQAYAHSAPGRLAAADPVPYGIGVLAAVLLVVALGRLTAACRRHAGELRALAALRSHPAAGDLIVLADDRADAYALPGRPGRIVVTTGMLSALSAEERSALIAHERSHLTHRHYSYAAAAQAAAAVNPLLGRLRDQLAFDLERWADEEAAAAVASRRLTARSLARAALATTCIPAPPAALAYVQRRITTRVSALNAPPPGNRWARSWPAVTAALGTSLAAADVAVALARCLSALIP